MIKPDIASIIEEVVDEPPGTRMREAGSESIPGGSSTGSGILAALRRSPLVGADLECVRQDTHPIDR